MEKIKTLLKILFKIIINPIFIKVLNSCLKFIINLGRKYIKPFFFSKRKPTIMAPYFYVFVGMILFFTCVVIFLVLCWKGATEGIKETTTILSSLAGVIATLVAMNTLMVKVYNEGKEIDSSTEENIGGRK